MRNLTGREHVARHVLVRWTFHALREVSTIAHHVYTELRRLNRGSCGDLSVLHSREQTQAFKAALIAKYQERSRCC